MLASLSIRDVVLIEKLDLTFQAGLSVFTGETGAGKSILLDSLSLALGARAESGLVRHGAAQGTIIAEFDVSPDHPARRLLLDQDMDAADGPLLLRRVLTSDGRSKAYVNDQAVSIGLLRKVGDALVEIHGQFESHGLLDPDTHQSVLDAFAGLAGPLSQTRAAWTLWRDKAKARQNAEAMLAAARTREEELRAQFEDLSALAPKLGEESQLAESRAMMQHGEKLAEAVNLALAALTQKAEVAGCLRAAGRHLERAAALADGKFAEAIATLDRAAQEAADATLQLERLGAEIDLDPRHLEKVEERLFALRAAARKHGTDADGLVTLQAQLAEQLAGLDGNGDGLVKLAREEQAARQAYVTAARALSNARAMAAKKLDQAVAAELAPLKLDRARFVTRTDPVEEKDWAADGLDQVEFLVSTNPGTPPAPLAKVASGGELSRFMLALKVILARSTQTAAIVFDEVDSGIGGAVAAAVGDRLARLGQDVQVLVVTHSPQVAARGRGHFRVAKAVNDGKTATSVSRLTQDQREEEIARMLAGEIITDQARAAARSLLG